MANYLSRFRRYQSCNAKVLVCAYEGILRVDEEYSYGGQVTLFNTKYYKTECSLNPEHFNHRPQYSENDLYIIGVLLKRA